MKRLLVLMLSRACSLPRAATQETAAAEGASSSAEEVELTVSAASSLTAAFTDIGAAFEDANPGVNRDLQLRAVGRSRDADQRGCAVDVFASASPTWMEPYRTKVRA